MFCVCRTDRTKPTDIKASRTAAGRSCRNLVRPAGQPGQIQGPGGDDEGGLKLSD